MARKTKLQTNREFLESSGSAYVATLKRYVVMTSPVAGEFYYLGRAGAIRRGKTVRDSIPVRLS